MQCGSSGQDSRPSESKARHDATIVKYKKTPRTRWVADFETTTDPNDCRVWGWSAVNIDDPDLIVIFGIDIESFCEFASKLAGQIFFHNLAFDSAFIIDHLMRNGYRHYGGDGRMVRGEFSTLISNMGKFYSVSVNWKHSDNMIEFRDSLKKLPMSVSNVSKAFNLPESKLKIDYDEYREPGHELTEHEKDYMAHDVIIIAKALKEQFDEGMTKLTIGSDSLNEYKQTFGRKDFSRMFPLLSSQIDAEIRRAYRGGWTYADSRWRGRVIQKSGKVYDVNSLYPYIMYDRRLPYDFPIFRDGGPEEIEGYPLYIATFTFTAKLKPNRLPCIQIKGTNIFAPNVYQEVIDEPVTISATNVDIVLWFEHYDIDVHSWDGVWYFKGATGLFSNFIRKWMQVKEGSDGGKRTIAKLHLNSLYGKFATNPNVTGKYPVFEDNVIHLRTGPEEMRDPVYTPMGVFITAYARDKTIRAAQDNYDTFAYADTDSLHLFTDEHPSNLDIDKSRLGAWKHEMDFDAAIYVRPKCYSELSDGKYHTHIAGVPLEIAEQVTFNDFRNGKVFHGKLTPKRVPGGIVLVDTPYTLTDPSLEHLDLMSYDDPVAGQTGSKL